MQMSFEMNYRITVYLNGSQFFSTGEKCFITMLNVGKIYKVFQEKFPLSEGYSITVLHCRLIETTVDMDGFLE